MKAKELAEAIIELDGCAELDIECEIHLNSGRYIKTNIFYVSKHVERFTHSPDETLIKINIMEPRHG